MWPGVRQVSCPLNNVKLCVCESVCVMNVRSLVARCETGKWSCPLVHVKLCVCDCDECK